MNIKTKMRPIKFHQYDRSGPIAHPTFISRDERIAVLADDIWGFGWSLEAQVIEDGLVEISVESHDEEIGTAAMRQVPNTPFLPEIVDAVIIDGHKVMAAYIERTRT